MEVEWRRLCPPLFRDTDAERLPQRELKRVLSWSYGPKGLLLHGSTGAGKTRCMYLLLKELHFAGCEILASKAQAFADNTATAYADGPSTGRQFIEKAITVPVFVLDDIGKARNTERSEAALFDVIDSRSERCLPVIAKINMVGKGLETSLSADRGSPLVRRLREFCETIPFVGWAKNHG